MEAFGVRFVVGGGAGYALAYVACGVALGTVSGLTPGLHANNFALLLAAVAGSVPGPPRLIGAAMLAAGVVHTFLDVVPALALGVPDPAMAASALPGHRLVLEGRGREALRLSALGSATAVVLAVPLAIPVTRAMTATYPQLTAHLPAVLTAVAAVLILTEPTREGRIGAGLSFAASGALGVLTLDLQPGGVLPADGMLAPLFAGLFGAPVLLAATRGNGVPPQADAAVLTTRRAVLGVAALGTVAGAVVGYLPGVSSAVAATLVLLAVPQSRGAREFVVATSGVNTATAVFALFAFVALGTPRTGVLVALDSTGAPESLPLYLGSIGTAAAVGFVLVLAVGDRYLRVVSGLDNRRLSIAVLAALAVLLWLLSGWLGVGVFVAATAVGSLPPWFGARRVSLMGVLLVPLIL
jgi:putative membrane protein